MRNGRNLYVLSPFGDETGLERIEFEAWGKDDAIARAKTLVPCGKPFALTRNGRPIGTVRLSDDGAWICDPAEP